MLLRAIFVLVLALGLVSMLSSGGACMDDGDMPSDMTPPDDERPTDDVPGGSPGGPALELSDSSACCVPGPYVKLEEGGAFNICGGFQGLSEMFLTLRVTGFPPNAVVDLSWTLEYPNAQSCTAGACPVNELCLNGVCVIGGEDLSDVQLTDIGGGVNEFALMEILFLDPLSLDGQQAVLSAAVRDASNSSIRASLALNLNMSTHRFCFSSGTCPPDHECVSVNPDCPSSTYCEPTDVEPPPPPPPPPPPEDVCRKGDVNFDADVDFCDVGPFVDMLLEGNADADMRCPADLNGDDVVNGRDIHRLVKSIMCGCGCTVQADCGPDETCVEGVCEPNPPTEDTTPPIITCPDGFTVLCPDTVPACNPADASATDDVDSDVAITCTPGPVVGDPCNGTITNTYTATDDSGNSATCTQDITLTAPPQDPPEWNPAFDTTGIGALSSVWGSGPSDVFVVGGTAPQAEIYHYDGTDWQEMNVPTGAFALVWVFGFGPNDVYAVGLAGTVLHYNGVAWTAKNSGSFQNLWGVWGSSPTDIWIVGDGLTFGDPNPLILHHDGNTTFTPHTLPYPAENDRNARSLFKVWGIGGRVFAVGDLGLIVEYSAGAWSQIESGANQKIVSLWGTSESNIVAVGGLTGGAQFSEYAGGVAWTSVNLPAFGGLNGVFMDTPDEAIIGGFVTAAGPGYVGRYDVATNTPTVELATIPQVVHAIWGDGQGRYYAVGGNFAFPFSGGQCWVRTYGDPGITPQPPLPPPP